MEDDFPISHFQEGPTRDKRKVEKRSGTRNNPRGGSKFNPRCQAGLVENWSSRRGTWTKTTQDLLVHRARGEGDNNNQKIREYTELKAEQRLSLQVEEVQG